MDSLRKEKQLEYNRIPVHFCKHCLSLNVRHVPVLEDSEYCDRCGCTDIQQASVEEWEKLYINKYGHRFLEEY